VDADTLTPYRESAQGAILQEGICEAGAMASFLAAGSAYANHGLPMVPFYLFYSMFGFQRVGDVVWACGDMLCRGFLVGGTSGRTTLNGEGLQHQDGHSQLVAGTVPSLLSYDPAFAYEVAVIVREGLRRMYVAQDKVFYYLTVTNEPHAMPAMPGDEVAEGVIRGLYRFREAPLQTGAGRAVRLLSSGAILQQALAAQELLAEAGVAAEVWSAPSFNELQRDALACERWNRLHPRDPPRVPYVAGQLGGGPLAAAPVIAATDYVKAYPLAIAPWVPAPYTALGTDGYGLSESRADARDHFEVSARYIAHAALHGLCRAGALADAELAEWSRRHDIRPDKPDAATA
jgi:pyruvate dehydrogenase E1 component